MSVSIIQITAPISHGNSGSPVFNMRGQVLGVVTIKVTNGQNINLSDRCEPCCSVEVADKLRPLAELSAKSKT